MSKVPAGSYLFKEAEEAQAVLRDELGEHVYTHLHDPVLTAEQRRTKALLLLIDTFAIGQVMSPGNYTIPVTLVAEAIEAVLGRKVN